MKHERRKKKFLEKECILGPYSQSSFRKDSPVNFHLLFREAALEAELSKPGMARVSCSCTRPGQGVLSLAQAHLPGLARQDRPTSQAFATCTFWLSCPLLLSSPSHPGSLHRVSLSHICTLLFTQARLFLSWADRTGHAQRFWITKAPKTEPGLLSAGRRVCVLASCKSTRPSGFPSFLWTVCGRKII